MFIVKAMGSTYASPAENYTVWQCDHYSVGPCQMQTSDKNWIRPHCEVTLYKASGPLQPVDSVCTISVGLAYDQGQYGTVYVMNDRGKTIDTIQARDS
jgi:hypothetical protein